jgi:hypothetical protein
MTDKIIHLDVARLRRASDQESDSARIVDGHLICLWPDQGDPTPQEHDAPSGLEDCIEPFAVPLVLMAIALFCI